jgi:excisionase family DNA binding protein
LTRRKRLKGEVRREWLTYRQAEQVANISRTTLWKLVSEGEVEAARVGRAVRINRDSLNGYMTRSAYRPAEREG